MVELKTTCGTTFMVDEDIAAKIRHLSWKLDKDGYVIRKTTIAGKRGRTVRLHRVVAGCTDRRVLIDHWNCDKLDNTRANLREATHRNNSHNSMKSPGYSSVFRGVTWNRNCSKWQSGINSGGKYFYLGLFEDEHEAGHAYNRAAVAFHGDFARLNPIGSKSWEGQPAQAQPQKDSNQ